MRQEMHTDAALGRYPVVNQNPGPDFGDGFQVGSLFFHDKAAAIAAADDTPSGKFIEWDNGTGHVRVTPERQAEIEAWADEAEAS
jgi:hypothetical protein